MSSVGVRQRYQRFLSRGLTTARLRVLCHGLLTLLAVGGLMTVLAAWTLGLMTAPPVALKIGLAASCLLACLTLGRMLLWLPLRGLSSRADLCAQLERNGSYRNYLLAAEEACRRRDRWDQSSHIDPDLVQRLMLRTLALVDRLSLGRQLPLPGAGRVLAGLLVTAVLFGSFYHFAPDALRRGYTRLSRPWTAEDSAATIGLYLAEGPASCVAGEDITVAALDFSAVSDSVVCEVRSGTGLWRQLDCQATPSTETDLFRRWAASLPRVQESFSYRFRCGSLTTASRNVAVLHPPLLTRLTGQVIPPAYTGLESQDLNQIPGYLELLAGSRLRWHGVVNHPVTWAAVITTAGDSVALTTRRDSVLGEILVEEPCTYSFHLRDDNGLEGSSRVRYELSVLADSPPLVRLWRPADDGVLPVAGIFNLQTEVVDDYGLSRLDLLCRREDGLGWSDAGEAWLGDDSVEPGGDRSDWMPPETDRDPGAPRDADPADDRFPWDRLTIWTRSDSSRAGNTDEDGLTLATNYGPLSVRVAVLDSTLSGQRLEQILEVNAGNLDLVPGDVLALCLEAHDNREPPPAGSSRSRVIRLVLPSAAEILTAQATDGVSRPEDLEAIRRRSEVLGNDLERLDRELQKDPLPDWARQQELEGAIARQKALQDELKDMADQLQSDLSSLMENHLTSMELVQKMDQISDLLAQIQNQELDLLLAQLQEAVAKLSAQEISEAIAEVARNQQGFVRRLDRALAMLQEMSREQELEGMTSLLAKMIRQQQDLLEENRAEEPETDAPETAAADSSAGDHGERADSEGENQNQDDSKSPSDQEGAEQGETSEQQAQRQQALADEMERLEQQLQEALERLQQEQANGDDSPSAEELQKALEKALEEMSRRQTSKSMQDAAEQLQQDNQDGASEQQQQALRDLASLYHVLLSSQQGMQMALMQHQVTSLRHLAADLLDLSNREESIADLIPSELRNIQTGDLTRQQFRVLKGGRQLRDRLQELPTSSPHEILRLLEKLDDLVADMDQTVRSLEASQGKNAQRTSRRSLGAMNEIIIGLLTEAQKACSGSCSNPSAMPSMSQQLRDMARQQAGLNGLTDMLRQQLGQMGLSQEVRAQMERLQGNQGNLAADVRDLAEQERQLQTGERLLGDMERLAAEMERIAQNISDGLVNEETLIRQERILSRLLDAHNSARKRDFSSRRESNSTPQLYAVQEGEADPNDPEQLVQPNQLRYQPVEEAPLEYRDLVRRYFQAIEQLHTNGEKQAGAEDGS
ncbi:MAG: hypothetical protein ABIF77_22120 [bacterium]